jgi:AraC-like DNA-binding protein
MAAIFEYSREYDEQINIFYSKDDYCFAHFHSNIEIVYVISGEITIAINGITKILTAGCVSIANSYDIHFYNSLSCEVYVIIIPLNLVKNYTALTKSFSFKTPFLDPCEVSEEILHVALQLMNEELLNDKLISKGYAYVLLGLLRSKLGMEFKSKINNVDLARRILIILQEKFLEDITIEKLSSLIGYNKDYLSRFINMYLGSGFNNIVNTLRVRYATQLISNGETSMTEIALQSGFNNNRTFNRAFLSVFKVTPTEYRNNLIK